MARFTLSSTWLVPDADDASGTQLLLVALTTAILFHGALLPFTHVNTYDAFIHMFFADHYHRNWFDPWEPRWYTGFSTTSYPPGTHMAIAGLMYLMSLREAFIVVQLTGIALLTVGVYRFSLLWVRPRAAGYAALALTLASSISETVHLFGQLPTVFSLGVFLNSMPYVYRWIVKGGWHSLFAAVVFSAATTAAHHVTTIFGGVVFVIPLALQALRAVAELNPVSPGAKAQQKLVRFYAPLARGILLAVLMIAGVALTVFPYWYWSISDPITQVPIPHGSRESFIARPDLGFVFFLLPWGASLLILPYAIYKTFTSRLWPLGGSVLLCFVLGTGGTTPIPRAILGGAFDIMTLDRFTYWASILILPFTGHLIEGLLHGRLHDIVRATLGRGMHRVIVGGLLGSFLVVAIFAAILPTISPTQPRFIDPAPIVNFLEQDEHDRWRYLTLGLGDQFAYLSSRTTAQSVDGNYHSARRLPDLTRFSVERLENAKYLGIPGLGSLNQFLVNAERYNLKYVFSNDAFYDPLLHFTGWNKLNRLENGTVVWEKPDVSPLPLFQPRREIPKLHALMWGVLPPIALIMAGMIFFASAMKRNFGAELGDYRPVMAAKSDYPNPRKVRRIVAGLAGLTLLIVFGLSLLLARDLAQPRPPEQVIEQYFVDLDFRKFGDAYAALDPDTRKPLEEVMLAWRWRGGLVSSFGKLTHVASKPVKRTAELIDWDVRLDWLTALNNQTELLSVRTVRRGNTWFVVPMLLRPVQTPVRLQRESVTDWNVVGRRAPRAETDLHRDRLDRPRIALSEAYLVRHDGKFSVVGQVTNTDVDPAAVSISARLTNEDSELTWQAAGLVNGSRLLPFESAGVRIDFEGVLSMDDAALAMGFDPTLFVPPVLDAVPDGAMVDGRALVSAHSLYRGMALNSIQIREDGEDLLLEGLAVNTGTETATITRLNALLFDQTGMPVWADVGFVDTNVYPGQSSPFILRLPNRASIEVVTSVPPTDILINGSDIVAEIEPPDAKAGTLPLNGLAGWQSVRLHLSVMTFDPLF